MTARMRDSIFARIKGITGLRATLLLLFFVCIGIGVWFYIGYTAVSIDAPLKKTFEKVATITSYTQTVQTEMQFPDRQLAVTGTYHVNTPADYFASRSTTTLTLLDEVPQEHRSFTLQNISLGSEVYTKVETDNAVLRATIPHSPEWRHFKHTEIPQQFSGIAIPGAILHNLKILSEDGRFLKLTEKHGEEMLDGQPMLHYSFALSGATPDGPLGPLNALLERIGPEGTVELWLDEALGEPRRIHFQNPNYHSTTTISDINTPLPPLPPTNLNE